MSKRKDNVLMKSLFSSELERISINIKNTHEMSSQLLPSLAAYGFFIQNQELV